MVIELELLLSLGIGIHFHEAIGRDVAAREGPHSFEEGVAAQLDVVGEGFSAQDGMFRARGASNPVGEP